MQEAKHIPAEFKGQRYGVRWMSVLMSERAQRMADEMAILYSAFPRALDKALVGILNEVRRTSSGKIHVSEILAEEDVPSGLKLSWTVSEAGLMICDLWTPIQPSLFGVPKSG